jgi:hypothetical protein
MSSFIVAAKSQPETAELAPVIKQCHKIQMASVELYEALELACCSRREHHTHLQVEQASGAEAKHDDGSESSHVHFCLGLSEKTEESDKNYRAPTWFVFKSIPKSMSIINGDANAGKDSIIRLGLAMKRGPRSHSFSFSRKRPKRETIYKAVTTSREGLSTDGAASSQKNIPIPPGSGRNALIHEEGSIPNFCIAGNLCIYISRMSKQPASATSGYVGRLHKSSVTHELYLDDQEKFSKESISLEDLITNMAGRRRIDQLPLLECIRLGRNLALAVLYFHETPVLKPSWNARDVAFFGLKESRDLSDSPELLPVPYLRATIHTEKLRPASDKVLETQVGSSIRNHYLFRLGILLLELAYQARLQSLRRGPGSPVQIEFEIADQYSRKVGSIMGPRYARIVRRCLGCDFGQDVDLAYPGLRGAVHKNVVMELEGLAHDFEKMEISE